MLALAAASVALLSMLVGAVPLADAATSTTPYVPTRID
jgi:hypothetical protein